jgi:hypothetical protein
MALANSLIGSTNTNLVVVPAGKQYAILTLMVCNTAAEDPTGSNDSKFDLHFVPQGQSIGAVNQDLSQGVPFTTRSFGPMPAQRGFGGNAGKRAFVGGLLNNQTGIGGIATSLGTGIALRSSIETANALEQQRLKLAAAA